MTSLDKPVLRKVSVGSTMLRRDPLIIVLHPGGFIGIREQGRRSHYKIDLQTVVSMAVRATCNKMEARVKELCRKGMKLGEARRQAAKECLQKVEE